MANFVPLTSSPVRQKSQKKRTAPTLRAWARRRPRNAHRQIRGGDASRRGGCGALSLTRLELAPRPSANQGFHFFDIGRVFFVVAGSQVAQAGPNPFPESPPLISPDNFSERLELISPGWAHQSIRLAVHEGRRLLTFERRMHDRLHGIDRPGEKSP